MVVQDVVVTGETIPKWGPMVGPLLDRVYKLDQVRLVTCQISERSVTFAKQCRKINQGVYFKNGI